MSRRRIRRRPQSAEINVTSLVDVAFTLLIVFIIVAPVMQSGIAVDLPQAEAKGIDSHDESLTVTVTAQGQVHIGADTVAVPDLSRALSALASAPAATPVYLRADRTVSYEQVVRVLGVMTGLGYTQINLVSDRPG
jgi:biopolymer transport protein TolR